MSNRPKRRKLSLLERKAQTFKERAELERQMIRRRAESLGRYR